MRVLRRPMFRGSVPQKNEGIMDGLVDRKGYQTGSENPYIKEAMEAFSTIQQPQDTDLASLAVSGGLNLMSGRGAGSGTLANIARSYEEPFKTFTASQAARRSFPNQLKMAAVKSGLEQKFKMDQIARENLGKDRMQKDYTTDRKYFELVTEYTKAPKDRYSKTITNLYPHGMAEFGSRIQDNAYKTEEGATVMQQMNGVVPHEIKSGVANWDYGKMDAGAYYYHPGIKAFVQRQPRTDETPAQLIVINPYTFKELRRQNLE